MLIFNKHIHSDAKPDHSVALPFDKRVRGRLRISLDNDGGDAGIDIQRGDVLVDGARLQCDEGFVLLVNAAPETVSVANTCDPQLFARACYHVGNRHAQVQIGEHELIYLHDHVLDEMLTGLGLTVVLEIRAFDPENGAYAGGHSHSHDHENEHTLDHDLLVTNDSARTI